MAPVSQGRVDPTLRRWLCFVQFGEALRAGEDEVALGFAYGTGREAVAREVDSKHNADDRGEDHLGLTVGGDEEPTAFAASSRTSAPESPPSAITAGPLAWIWSRRRMPMSPKARRILMS